MDFTIYIEWTCTSLMWGHRGCSLFIAFLGSKTINIMRCFFKNIMPCPYLVLLEYLYSVYTILRTLITIEGVETLMVYMCYHEWVLRDGWLPNWSYYCYLLSVLVRLDLVFLRTRKLCKLRVLMSPRITTLNLFKIRNSCKFEGIFIWICCGFRRIARK